MAEKALKPNEHGTNFANIELYSILLFNQIVPHVVVNEGGRMTPHNTGLGAQANPDTSFIVQ